jgi:hypothetical protein
MPFRNNLRVVKPSNEIVTVEQKKLEIKQSTKVGAGNGVFACEDILQGTVFMECKDFHLIKNDHIDKMINDLAFDGNVNSYDNDQNIEMNTNIGYVVKYEHECIQFFGGSPSNLYLYALKDIKASEELSRHYGLNFWQTHCFWDRFPDCKYQETYAMEDLPNEYILIDSIRSSIKINYCKQLYGKKVYNKVEAIDKYHYFVSTQRVNYMDNNFLDSFSNINVVTKSDFSIYNEDEEIFEGMYLTSFLKRKYDATSIYANVGKPQIIYRNELQKDHNLEDLSESYTLIDCLEDKYNKDICYKLYCKKFENVKYTFWFFREISIEYHYLVSSIGCPSFNVEYVEHKEFNEKIENYIDVTKKDKTRYEINEKIHNMNFRIYSNILKECQCNIKSQQKKDFWSRHPECEYDDTHINYYNNGCIVINNTNLPNEYVPIYTLQFDDNDLKKHTLFCKKNGDEYFYLLDLNDTYCSYADNNICYYQPEFKNRLVNFLDITKSDKTIYGENDVFDGIMRTSTYFRNKMNEKINRNRQLEMEFWETHMYSNYKKTKDINDLPSEYMLIDTVKHKNNNDFYKLLGKKENNKFYYLLCNKNTGKYESHHVNYYDIESLGVTETIDVTKDDYSPYQFNECINCEHSRCELYFQNYLCKLMIM